MTTFKATVIQPGLTLTEPLFYRAQEQQIMGSGIGGEMSPNVQDILKVIGVMSFSMDK